MTDTFCRSLLRMCDCDLPNTLGTHGSVHTGRIRRRIEQLPPIVNLDVLPCCAYPPTIQPVAQPCPPPTEKTMNTTPICGPREPVYLDVSGEPVRFDLPHQSPIPRAIDRVIPVDVRRPRAGRHTAQIRDRIIAREGPQWTYGARFNWNPPCTAPILQTVKSPIPSLQSCNYGNSRTVDGRGRRR
jgi:hypothetical protein